MKFENQVVICLLHFNIHSQEVIVIVFIKMPKARSHEENRKCICLFCFGKTKTMIPINKAIQELVNKYFEYDEMNKLLPVVLCSSCKRNLYHIKDDSTRKVYLPDFSQLKSMKKFTRSTVNNICDCTICDLARKPQQKFPNLVQGDTLPARKSILTDVANVKSIGN